MILTLAAILVVLWLIGLIAHIAGAFIYLLLLIAIAMAITDFVLKNRHPKQ